MVINKELIYNVEEFPNPVKNVFKVLGFGKLYRACKNIVFSKYDDALLFQRKWATEFKENKSKVLEYWKNYRYLDEIIKICNITDDSKVLDVGCGISTVLHYVKGRRFGIDPLADEFLELYTYPENICIKKGFGELIPFQDNYFDIIFCSNALDHVTSPSMTIGEIRRVLKTGGYFVLTVEIFEEKVKRDSKHPHSLTKRDIYLLFENKFKIIFEKESPWIGLRNYVNTDNPRKSLNKKSCNKELIMILEKTQ